MLNWTDDTPWPFSVCGLWNFSVVKNGKGFLLVISHDDFRMCLERPAKSMEEAKRHAEAFAREHGPQPWPVVECGRGTKTLVTPEALIGLYKREGEE